MTIYGIKLTPSETCKEKVYSNIPFSLNVSELVSYATGISFPIYQPLVLHTNNVNTLKHCHSPIFPVLPFIVIKWDLNITYNM